MATRSGFDISGLIAKAQRVPDLIERQLTPVLEKQGRLFIKEMIKWTPPASQGKTGKKAHEQGKMAITSDLLGLKGGRSKEQRTAGVFVVMKDEFLKANAKQYGKSQHVRLFVKKDGTVYGTDRQHFRPNATNAEMYAHHQSMRRKGGRVSTAGGATRDVGRWKFIDQMVVSRSAYLRYERMIQKRVGILAGGWNAAAKRFGYRPPAWVAKHGESSGAAMLVKSAGKLYYELRNTVRYGAANGMQRRVNHVVSYRKRAIQAAAAGALRAGLRGAGFSRVRSTGVALAA